MTTASALPFTLWRVLHVPLCKICIEKVKSALSLMMAIPLVPAILSCQNELHWLTEIWAMFSSTSQSTPHAGIHV
jgi:hypothetical protein